MEKHLIKIKDYYERAWKAIAEKNFKEATKILYKEMSMKLYDISINIEYLKLESKPDFTEEEKRLLVMKEELKHLISKVSKALAVESGISDDTISEEDLPENIEEGITDNFNNTF